MAKSTQPLNFKANSILKVALSTKVALENLDALVEIIESTNNPEIAAAIFLGIYEKPELPLHAKDMNSEINRTLVSVNYINDKVYYTYQSRNYSEGYCLKSIENPTKSDLLKEYFKSDCYKALGITEEEFNKLYCKTYVYGEVSDTISKTTTSISDWCSK